MSNYGRTPRQARAVCTQKVKVHAIGKTEVRKPNACHYGILQLRRSGFSFGGLPWLQREVHTALLAVPHKAGNFLCTTTRDFVATR